MEKIKEAVKSMLDAGVTYKRMADLINLQLAKMGSGKAICTRTLMNAKTRENPSKMQAERREAIMYVSKKFK